MLNRSTSLPRGVCGTSVFSHCRTGITQEDAGNIDVALDCSVVQAAIFGEMFSQTYTLNSNAADRDLCASTKMSRITPAPRPMS